MKHITPLATHIQNAPQQVPERDGPTVQPARCHDRATPSDTDDLPAGSLALQVGILFRLWKGCLRVKACRSWGVWRVLCGVYAGLMGAVLWHWLLLV
jgi:hypothetical protein